MNPIPGVVIGVVKRLDDETGEGRIQVEFPWLSGDYRSGWAPVAASLAGSGRGAFFMPEPEDEVLVAFEQGDVDHPFIVGFLWNGRDRPPETDPSNRVIRTPGEHMLRFEDKEGAKKVILKSSSGHTIELDDASGGGSITIKSSGKLEIKLDDAASSITLSGGGRTITMQGAQVRIA